MIEPVLENRLCHANESNANGKQALEATEKQHIKNLPDSEAEGTLLRLMPGIDAATKKAE